MPMLSVRYLEELQDPARPIFAAELANLSGLSAPEVEQFRGYWSAMTPPRRLQLLRQMNEMAEDNAELDFQEVFHLGLQDAAGEVRVAAIEGLWECQEPWLLEALAGLMQQDGDEEVRATAASHLGKFALLAELGELRPRDAARVRQALQEVVHRQDEGVEVRRRALEAISPFSDDTINGLIRAAYHSDLPKMRVSSVYAMGVHCDPGWLPVLLAELKSENPEMRYEAARACGELEDERAVPTLVEAARDEDSEVREVAIEALGRIGGAKAKRALRRLLAAPEAATREAAKRALEELQLSE